MQFKLFAISLALISGSLALEIRSPSGRLIPPALLSSRLPRSSTTHLLLSPSDHVYEIIDKRVKGYDINLDIFSETSRIDTNPRDSGFTYVENGASARRLSRNSHVRMGKGYTVVYGTRNSEEKHEVVAVHGHGLKLVPLDRDNYPGILVNIGSRSRLQPSGDDIIRIKVPDDDGIGNEPILETEIDGAPDNSTRQVTVRQSNSCRNGVRHYFEVAIAYDHTFCALFGGDADSTNAYIQSVVDIANVAYKRDTCVELCLVHIESNCRASTDPYRDFDNFPSSFPSCSSVRGTFTPCDPSSFILYNFRTYWNSNRRSVHRDAAYLFTGFEDGTGVAGVAFLSAACGSVGYGWVEGTSALVFAHEAGHTLGGDHTRSGIMVAIGISSSFFNSQSQNDFINYIDGRQTCITTGECKFDPATCPNARDGKCIPGSIVPAGLVPCSSISSYYCVENKYGGRNFAEDCSSNYGYVRESPDPSNPIIRCCKPTSETTTDLLVPRSTNLAGIRLFVNGRSQVFYNWLPSNAGFVTKTLMKTEVVPDCVNGPPSSSPAPTTTSSVSPSPISSAPTPSPTPSPNSESDSCGENFNRDQTFSCTKRRRIIRFRSNVLRIKPVDIRFNQEFGVFRTSVATNRASRVTHYGVIVSTDGTIDASGIPVMVVPNPNSRPKLRRDFDAFKMKLPSSASNCCSGRIYIYVRIRLCRAGSVGVCVGGTATVTRTMACRGSCSKPFSSTRKCPACF